MKKIKIAIIAHPCRTGGSLVATVNLLKALKNVAQNEQFLVVCSTGYGYEKIELPSNSELFVYEGSHSPLARYWFERITLPKLVGNYEPDVIFGVGNIGLIRPRAPQALFIQQACLLYDKKHYSDTSLWFQVRLAVLKSQIKKSLPATNLIFCQTPVVKQRFSEKFHYPEDQIKIIRFSPPVEVVATPGSEVPSVFDKSSGNFYVLLLTCYFPYRNPSILIPLCKRYGSQIRAKRIKFITTVEAREHPRAGVFLKRVPRHNLEDVIINVGRLSREDVPRYLLNSQALWLPTMVETLGLPYLEAMSLGVPILAPDLDFARYVCGDAALYYDPWDLNRIFRQLVLIREDARLREDLIAKGRHELTKTEKFAINWNAVAKDVLTALREISRR